MVIFPLFWKETYEISTSCFGSDLSAPVVIAPVPVIFAQFPLVAFDRKVQTFRLRLFAPNAIVDPAPKVKAPV